MFTRSEKPRSSVPSKKWNLPQPGDWIRLQPVSRQAFGDRFDPEIQRDQNWLDRAYGEYVAHLEDQPVQVHDVFVDRVLGPIVTIRMPNGSGKAVYPDDIAPTFTEDPL